MALGRRGRSQNSGTNYWPGFVDAMATLLLVMTFLLSIFMLTQHFAAKEANSKDDALRALNRKIASLTELLALEQNGQQGLKTKVSTLQASLGAAEQENRKLKAAIGNQQATSQSATSKVSSLTDRLNKEQQISAAAQARVTLLAQQIEQLRRQLAVLNTTLSAYEKRDKEAKIRIDNLGKRLNVALARKVQELEQYRSDFFGKLLKILKSRGDVQVVGDRFVFQAEVLFGSGSSSLNPQGMPELDKLADALNTLRKQIPQGIDWVLRVDGHTDDKPINTPQFPSNWELSSARAISVVRYLISKGVPANRLVAAGFGQYHPLDPADTDEARSKNRRIELKLTQK